MTHSISGDEKFPGLAYDDDYRSYLITRSVPLTVLRPSSDSRSIISCSPGSSHEKGVMACALAG